MFLAITSWTSTDTHVESKNLSTTKIYSFGFNHEVELSCKNGVKNLSYSRNILCKIIKQSNWQRDMGFECQNPKNQTFKLLEITESTCCFYGCLSICIKKKKHSWIQSWYIANLFMKITFDMPGFAWP